MKLKLQALILSLTFAFSNGILAQEQAISLNQAIEIGLKKRLRHSNCGAKS